MTRNFTRRRRNNSRTTHLDDETLWCLSSLKGNQRFDFVQNAKIFFVDIVQGNSANQITAYRSRGHKANRLTATLLKIFYRRFSLFISGEKHLANHIVRYRSCEQNNNEKSAIRSILNINKSKLNQLDCRIYVTWPELCQLQYD